MKKRKELDALVPNGKRSLVKAKVKKVVDNQLLDSDTSDMDDFSILRFRRGTRKKNSGWRLCTPCLPLCLFVLITTSVVALGTFIWLHLGLREDLDMVRAHLQKVEAQCKETPEALHDYHIQLKFLDSNVSLFGEEVKKINSEIATIKKDVEKLKQSSAEIKASIAAAPEIKTLPKDVESLSESVASIGSKISALETLVKELKVQQSSFASSADSIAKQQEALKESMQEILNATSSKEPEPSTTPATGSPQVTEAIAQINASLTPRVDRLDKYVDILNKSVFAAQKQNNHTHEVVHSLQKYVQQNLTLRVSTLEDNSHSKALQELLDNKLTQALNCSYLSLANDSSVSTPSWTSLLSSANQMVSIYMQLYHQLNDGDGSPPWNSSDGAETAAHMLNKTLGGLFHKQSTDIQRLHEELESFASGCETAVGHLDHNLTLVTHRVDDIAAQIGLSTKDSQVRNVQSPTFRNLLKSLPPSSPIPTET